MRAYSIDLRKRVLAAVDRGMPRAEIAQTFGVSLSTIKRLIARRRREEGLAPKVSPGRPRGIGSAQEQVLWAQLEAHKDASIETHTRLFNDREGTSLSPWTVGRAIRRLGWTRKKRRWELVSGTNSSADSTGSR